MFFFLFAASNQSTQFNERGKTMEKCLCVTKQSPQCGPHTDHCSDVDCSRFFYHSLKKVLVKGHSLTFTLFHESKWSQLLSKLCCNFINVCRRNKARGKMRPIVEKSPQLNQIQPLKIFSQHFISWKF